MEEGKYQISVLGKIGSGGGNGTVYKVKDLYSGKVLAMKSCNEPG